MSTSFLLHDLSQVCTDLRSDKINTRNKAMEKLDGLLTNSKNDLMSLYTRGPEKVDPSWKKIFNSCIDGAMEHSKKVQDAEGSKTFQTQRNKNFLYSSLINRLIDLSLEDNRNLLDQSTIITAFKDGYGNVTVRKNFGRLFLQILERGVYDSAENTRGIKASELSSILSYLFEMNIPDDENLKLALTRCINRTVELCQQYVQLRLDLRDYFPEVISMAKSARDEKQQVEVIKLFFLFTSELSVDYHFAVCDHIQEILPVLCEYYSFRMKTETKTYFFRGVYCSLKTIYPNLMKGDYNTIGISLNENWMKTTLRKLNAIVEVESKEQAGQLQRPSNNRTDELQSIFFKTSAMIVYLVNWADTSNLLDDDFMPRAKTSRPTDPLELLLASTTVKDYTSINQISLEIFTELIVTQPQLINPSNFKTILESHLRCLPFFSCWQSLKCLRIGFSTLLQLEQKLVPCVNQIPENWKKIVEFLIADTCTTTEVLTEKHLLLHELIRANKFELEDSTTLLNFLLVNSTMRRNECIATIREIMRFNENCGLDKTSDLIVKLLNWLYQSTNKIDGKSLLLNLEPLNEELLADTCAFMVINFLDSPLETVQVQSENEETTELINYKYCRKYICIEEHGKELKRKNENESKEKTSRCVVQNNYELLMRLLNFETSREATLFNITTDLTRLLKMVLVLRKFFDYDIFNVDTFVTCPLTKRIGFFLDNLDFQLKTFNVRETCKSELLDVVEILLEIFNNICQCKIFLGFLEKQKIDGLIAFAGSILKVADPKDSKKLFLNTMKLLATLCSSPVHSQKAFAHIKQQRLILKENLFGILSLIQIFCQQQESEEIAVWFGEKLKTMCQLYYSNIELCDEIVDIIPEIVRYVEPFPTELDVCLIIISSFLKITSKKYYSTRFAAKLIKSIRQIIKNCPNLIAYENFTTICLMLPKFLSSQSIDISFSAVDTITALMDSNWFAIHSKHVEKHFEFCCQLYSKLDWNNLPMEGDDIRTNSIAVAVQLLTSLFAFASFHREVAFKELGNFYALHNLNEGNFKHYGQIAGFYECSLLELTQPFVDALLCLWIQKKLPMSKFPFFFCAESTEKCFSTYLSTICYYLLRFCPTEGLAELQRLKYGSARQLIAKAYPTCYAFLLNGLSKNTQNPSANYVTEAKALLSNLNNLGLDVVSTSAKMHWSTIYQLTKQLWDECHFSAMFGFNLYTNTPALANSFLSLEHNLKYYLQKCYSISSSKTLAECVLKLMNADPMALLKVLAAFKSESTDTIFLNEKLKAFYWFCSLAEIIIESASEQYEKLGLNSTQEFFLRDILFFILNILSLGNNKGEVEMLKAGLHFLHHVLETNISTLSVIIDKSLNDIAFVLVSITQNSEPSVYHQMAINLLEMLICQHTTEFKKSIKLLDKFPDLDIYQNLREVECMVNNDREAELRWTVQDFLNTDTRGVIGLKSLKKNIAVKKRDLQNISVDCIGSSNLLYDLSKRLIDIVRGSDLTLGIESAKCLGEIGAVKITDTSFYFECDTTFYNMEFAYQDEMTFLAESLYRQLDKLLVKYDSASVVEMYAVCTDLANSRVGSKVLKSFPLLGLFSKQETSSVLDNSQSIESFSFVEILKKHENLAYDEFSKAFSSSVFEKCQWESFSELCKLNLSFSESATIPIFKVLLADRINHFNNIVAMLEHFFTRTFEAIEKEEWKTSRNIYSDKRIVKYFLNICECIRIHNNWNVPVNMLYVAKACIYCQAYFMGILYLEMWALTEKDKSATSKNSEITKNPIFQDIATTAFKSIDCVEAISGFLDPLTSRLEYLNLEGDWSQVLMEIDATNDLHHSLYTPSLKKNGLLMLSSSTELSNKIDYECCWRLGRWETAVETNSKAGSLHDLEFEFEKNHFNALKSIHNREEVNCMSAIDKARQAIISILKEISIECLQNIYKYLSWLQMLQQAEDFCQIQFSLGAQAESVLQKWKIEQKLKYGNFNCTELLLSHQMTLYKTAGIRAGRKIDEFFKGKSAIGECILKCINECKSAGNTNLAIRNIALLRHIETSEQLKAKAFIEDAEICWKTGKSGMAKAILHNVMLNKDFVYCLERIQAHRMYGELLLETNNETFDVVHEEFFVRSIQLLNKYSEFKDKIIKSGTFNINDFEVFDKESRELAFATIAKYADKEYSQLDNYLNSETFRTKVQIMMKNKAEAQSLARTTKDRDKSIGINVMLRNCGIDDKEIKMLELKRSQNLCIAMENYIQFCKLDKNLTSPAIYRIIALWFANKHDKKLHDKINEIIHEIPSYKFLCVLNQMSARLSSKNSSFLELLEGILIKCIEDHPHHTLHKIFALVFAYADDPKTSSTSDRVSIAKNIIDKVRNKKHSSCIKQMEAMFTALIDFANKDAGKSSSLTLSDKIRKLKNLEHVQCPTKDLPISVNKSYSLTYVRKWDDHVGLVGGINAPKKLMCICSDGVSRPQLLKGKDDLRQDAVMQQVLSMVNELLKSDPETNDQKLILRTYRIVPLSMRSGILEWCENTVPIGLYLCGDKKTDGAHKKYRPKDYTVAKCRTLSMEALKKQDFDQRLQIYLHICEKIKPVFHYFFFENFLVPGIWFERRLAYTKSIATTSIVGYILGLGDRHVQNILIDQLTAEVIHIDFGIAFEQGKIMPTPETVPFRLTRDIVAPMGVSETDGVFRKACEKTMKILRKNQVFLTTILEVLLYDPLYVWKWSSQKTLDGDKDGESEGKNLTAQRALLRVQDKLEGKEEGKMGTPNVEVQIQRLINEAVNAHNLCRLYPGWDPYL